MKKIKKRTKKTFPILLAFILLFSYSVPVFSIVENGDNEHDEENIDQLEDTNSEEKNEESEKMSDEDVKMETMVVVEHMCNATGSFKNPYSKTPRDISSIVHPQRGFPGPAVNVGPLWPEADWGDIISPFEYDGDGYSQNWPEGKAIWENDCKIPDNDVIDDQKISPILECVEEVNESYRAHFSYETHNNVDVTVPIGESNKFTGGGTSDYDQGQPTVFEYPAPDYPSADRMGRTGFYPDNLFSVDFDGSDLVWTLTAPDGGTRTATASDDPRARCPVDDPEPEASITVCKMIVDDEGMVKTDNEDLPEGDFEIKLSTSKDFTDPEIVEFSATDFSPNTTIFGDEENGECKTINWELGDLYYSEEHIEGDYWLEPLYNDEFETTVESLDYFYEYSPELFENDEDEDRNKDADGHIVLSESRPHRRLVVLNTYEEPEPMVNLHAYKVMCESETDFPEWVKDANYPSMLTEELIMDYVEDSEGACWFEPGWEFEWAEKTVSDPGGDHIGYGGDDWNTFGPTNENGIAIKQFDFEGAISIREVLQEGYLSFSDDDGGDYSKSAELICHTDGYNYDNYEWLENTVFGEDYYCAAFNVSEEEELVCDPGIILPEEGADICKGEALNLEAKDIEASEGDVQWAVRYDTCEKGEGAVAGNVDEYDDPFDWTDGIFIAELGTSGWYEGEYCFVFNPDDGERYTRRFNIDDCDPVCDPEVNLIENGSFEEPVVGDNDGDWQLYESISGWTLVEGDYIELQRYVFESADGDQHLELDSDGDDPASAIEQEVSTIPGQYYELTFAWSPRPDEDATDSKAVLTAESNGGTILTDTIETGYGDIHWQYKTYGFTADDSKTTIRFSHDGPVNTYGGLIDDVQLHCAEEPDPDMDTATIRAHKVICENGMPNWVKNRDYPSVEEPLTEKEIIAYVSETDGCEFTEEEWSFEWGYDGEVEREDGDHIGRADGESWQEFHRQAIGTTPALATVNLEDGDKVWVREILQGGYLPFSDQSGDEGVSESAEFICHTDGYNYDNYEYVDEMNPGMEYICVAFNSYEERIENGGDNGNNTGDNDLPLTPPISRRGSSRAGVLSSTTEEEPVEEEKTEEEEDKKTDEQETIAGEELDIVFPEEPSEKVCGIYLNDFLRYGDENNPEEVKKLQIFLNEHMGEDLWVDGYFGIETFEAVERFQLEYKEEILSPWVEAGIHSSEDIPTGYVFETTRRWINMIMCPELGLKMPDLSTYYSEPEIRDEEDIIDWSDFFVDPDDSDEADKDSAEDDPVGEDEKEDEDTDPLASLPATVDGGFSGSIPFIVMSFGLFGLLLYFGYRGFVLAKEKRVFKVFKR